ncbi:MAG: hypothetical protein AAF500_03865 [Myxococcota bacterium]
MRSLSLGVALAALTLTLASGCPSPNRESADEPATTETAQDAKPDSALSGGVAKPFVETPEKPLPEGRQRATGKTPAGASVSFGVPEQWTEAPLPNKAAVFEWRAPEKDRDAGARLTVVSQPFNGTLEDLTTFNKGRFESFAAIKEEGDIRMGNGDAHEFVANWQNKEGVQDAVLVLIATGQEGIAITCTAPRARVEDLRGQCGAIFETYAFTSAPAAPAETP